jgi:hypothetical protein
MRLLARPSKKFFVEAITPAQIFSQYGIPFYLKIDIEGADVCVLQELCQFSEKPVLFVVRV